MHIDHTTLRTAHIDQTRDFLLKVFDLVEGPRPIAIAERMAGYWLYHKDRPIIHIIESHPHPSMPEGYAIEALDHTAFCLEDYEGFKGHLESIGVRYTVVGLDDFGQRRIFIRTPTGILLEAVFLTK